jgi:hypothetical protein
MKKFLPSFFDFDSDKYLKKTTLANSNKELEFVGRKIYDLNENTIDYWQ